MLRQIKAEGLKALGKAYAAPAYTINPDEIAKALPGQFATQEDRDRAAFAECIRLRDDAIAAGKPFAYETVMSHPSRINEMLRLKEKNYTVLTTFITTDHPDKNVARVKQRVATQTTTGHDVPEKKVRERYERSLALLPKAAEIADAIFIYDNSEDFNPARMQLMIDRTGEIITAKELKPWVTERVLVPLEERSDERKAIKEAFANSGKPPLQAADELRGSYDGQVVCVTKHYLVQFDEATKTAIRHDRSMLETSAERAGYRQNDRLRISYSEHNAPEVARHEATRVQRAPARDEDRGR